MQNVRGMDREALTDVTFKFLAVVTLSYFAVEVIREWLKDPSRVTLLLLTVSACVSVSLSIVSTRPVVRNTSPLAVLLTLAATFYYPALILTPGRHIIPELAGAAMQVIGTGFEIYAKFSLGKSFGMLPARRTVVIRGAYRLVRHPMYLGYFIHFMGFLLANFGVQNLVIYAGLYMILILRIFLEEGSLKKVDQTYQLYCDTVKYRVIPFVF